MAFKAQRIRTRTTLLTTQSSCISLIPTWSLSTTTGRPRTRTRLSAPRCFTWRDISQTGQASLFQASYQNSEFIWPYKLTGELLICIILLQKETRHYINITVIQSVMLHFMTMNLITRQTYESVVHLIDLNLILVREVHLKNLKVFDGHVRVAG